MKFLLISLFIFSAHALGQNNTPEDCTLGIFNTLEQVRDVVESKAKDLYPAYIASHSQECSESSNTIRTYGSNGALYLEINGVEGRAYNPGAAFNMVSGVCWDCPVWCRTYWPSHKACYLPSCPSGHSLENGRCVQYSSVVPEEAPPEFCKVGNPIAVSSGSKSQSESDIVPNSNGSVGFNRIFSNSNSQNIGAWYHTYQKSLRIIKHSRVENIRAKSSPYATKAAACSNGFNDIKNQITDKWTQGTTVQYNNGFCQVMRNNIVVKNIAIVPHEKLYEIFQMPGSIQLIRDDGSIFNFGFSANNEYQPLSGEHGKLSSISTAAPIAWRYTAPNGDVEDYDADGKLLSIAASNGIKQELFYDAGSALLTRVKDSKNRELVFAYTGNQISSVTVDGNKTTRYVYNAVGLITQVTRPDSTTRIYHYEDARFPKALTGITDERGARYATWAYDAQGRAISSEHAGGAEKTLLAFNADGTTTVTNALNKKTIYHFDDITGARRVTKVEGQATTNCVGANQNYTYTPEGWVASKTDWKGIKTTFTYNALGQEISRTEAAGSAVAKTIATEWHATLNLKTKVTEPNKETTYSYDANGLLLNQKTRSLVAQ